MPCTADCECSALGFAGCTYQHQCGSVGRPPQGICYADQSPLCPCVGGTCDDRHCCLLPDGGIDPGWGPACNPPADAAPTGG